MRLLNSIKLLTVYLCLLMVYRGVLGTEISEAAREASELYEKANRITKYPRI